MLNITAVAQSLFEVFKDLLRREKLDGNTACTAFVRRPFSGVRTRYFLFVILLSPPPPTPGETAFIRPIHTTPFQTAKLLAHKLIPTLQKQRSNSKKILKGREKLHGMKKN